MKRWLALLPLILLLSACSQTNAGKVDSIHINDTWTSGEAIVENARVGMDEKAFMPLHNGEGKTVTFKIEYVRVSDVMKGYEMAPDEAINWLSFPETVTLKPKETYHIPIKFHIPAEVDESSLPKKWEFGIRAGDVDQQAVNYGVLCTWLVTMR